MAEASPSIFNPPWRVTQGSEGFSYMAVIHFGAGLRAISVALPRHEVRRLSAALDSLADALPPTPTSTAQVQRPPERATAVTFKHEDVNDDGEPIGPVFVSGEDGAPIFDFDWPGSPWLTLVQAKAFAQEYDLIFYED